MKKTFEAIPELFFMVFGMFWIIGSYFTLGSVDYFALLITWLLFLQFFYKNRMAGLVYGIGLGSFSVYMLLAIVSGYHESEVVLLVARSAALSTGLFTVGIVMAAVMVYKYVTTKVSYDESVLTTTY